MCGGMGWVQRSDTQFDPCPRCDQLGVEPKEIREITIVMRCFLSKSKGWINQLEVRTSHPDMGPPDVAKLLRDYLELIEERKIVVLPPENPTLT